MDKTELEKRRMDAYRKSGEFTQSVYGDPDLGKVLSSIATKFTLEKEKKYQLIDIVGDIILGLKKREDFQGMAVSEVGLTSEAVGFVAQQLKPFFDKASSVSLPETNLESRERLEFRPKVSGVGSTSAPQANGTNSVAGAGPKENPKPLTREELMNALAGKRTMAQDIEAVRMKREGEK